MVASAKTTAGETGARRCRLTFVLFAPGLERHVVSRRDGHRDRRQAAPRTRASAARHTRREGPRREGMIRHRHWREHESKPNGAAAPCRRLRRQHIPYCYPTVAAGVGRRSPNTAVRSPPRTSGEPGDQFSLAQASGRPRSCAFSISADTREGGRRHEGKYPRRMLARALPRGAAIHPYTSVHRWHTKLNTSVPSLTD